MRSLLRIGLCVFVVACGGAITNGDDAGTDGGPGKDSAPPPDAGTSGCPASPPSSGGACSPESIECEYGTNPSPSCNQLFQCNGGHWQDLTTGTLCVPQSDCPSSWSSVNQNGTCSPEGLGCAYPEGTCFCGGSLPMPNPIWNCAPETSACPSPRPDMGTSCNEPGQSCDYGSCSGGVALQCDGGIWKELVTPCPG